MNHQTKLEQAHREAERIFRDLIPPNGMTVREEQISLCHAMLNALFQNKIILCDAGTGIGKTYAYLTACVRLQKFRPARVQPVVISTSSVALQDAVVKEYILFYPVFFWKTASFLNRSELPFAREKDVLSVTNYSRGVSLPYRRKIKIWSSWKPCNPCSFISIWTQ